MRPLFGIVVCCSALFAVGGPIKCFAYDPALAPTDVAAAETGGTGTDAAGVGMAAPCAQPNEARIRIENSAYINICGCAEESGKICTISTDTTVVWTFGDSEEHNVSSVASAFGMSDDKLAGKFDHQFTAPGVYGYGCTLHPADMSDYFIIVE